MLSCTLIRKPTPLFPAKLSFRATSTTDRSAADKSTTYLRRGGGYRDQLSVAETIQLQWTLWLQEHRLKRVAVRTDRLRTDTLWTRVQAHFKIPTVHNQAVLQHMSILGSQKARRAVCEPRSCWNVSAAHHSPYPCPDPTGLTLFVAHRHQNCHVQHSRAINACHRNTAVHNIIRICVIFFHCFEMLTTLIYVRSVNKCSIGIRQANRVLVAQNCTCLFFILSTAQAVDTKCADACMFWYTNLMGA